MDKGNGPTEGCAMGCRQSAADAIRDRIRQCSTEAEQLQALLPVAEAMGTGTATEAALYELISSRMRGRY